MCHLKILTMIEYMHLKTEKNIKVLADFPLPHERVKSLEIKNMQNLVITQSVNII